MLTDRSRIARSLCSVLAIATATFLNAGAHAQTAPNGSLQGTFVFTSGTGLITTSAGTTTVSITSPNAVIDWTTFDRAIGGGPINFQPSNTTATFQSAADFSVLNRILPTDPSRAVQFNGNVISRIQNSTGSTPGGTVYFYSPGGVIVGSSAVFNVGNLGLTTADPFVSNPGPNATFINGFGSTNQVQFQQAAPGSFVEVQSGAQVRATRTNSYVALVAPRVSNAGSISVNGSAALVSADAARISFNVSGLFDILIDTGTSSTGTGGDGVTLFNSGSIGGFTNNFSSRVYLVAVPKNTAITMAIASGSTLGFDFATGASLARGGAIILSGSSNIVSGESATVRSAAAGSGVTGLNLATSSFSFLRGRVDGDITADPTSLITGGSNISLRSERSISIGRVNAVGIALTSSQTLTTGDLTAFGVGSATVPVIILSAGTSLKTGAVTATFQPTQAGSTVTNLTNIVLLARNGSVVAGDINTRASSVIALASGAVSLGAVTTGTNQQNNLYIANASVALLAGPPDRTFGFSFDVAPLFNIGPTSRPAPTSGPITISGAVNTGNLTASSAQGISLQAVTAGLGGFIDLNAGGLAAVTGRLAANQITIISNEIALFGSLDALSANGEISLISTNPAGAFIGDGLITTAAGERRSAGYFISNDEYSRIKAGTINVFAQDNPQLATDMTIGNLTITGSQLYGENGNAAFATGNIATETPSGTLRVAGAVNATGFTPTTEVDLFAGTFELETSKGSVKVSDSAGALGGLISIESQFIHVADDALLTKLRADPHYAGHIKDLNAPALVPRTDGVLNALALELFGSDTIYIQNTGTARVPAGFVTTLSDATDIGGDTTPPTGGRDIVFNGQFQTSTGLVTGKQAFDLAIARARADALANHEQFGVELAPASTFNGCVILSGVCAFGQTDPVAALSSEITVVTNAALDESPVAPAADDSDEGDDGSGDKDDDDDTSDEDSSPIVAPAPLISTRALDGELKVVEPVSGAGNPALFGSAVDETAAQGGKP